MYCLQRYIYGNWLKSVDLKNVPAATFILLLLASLMTTGDAGSSQDLLRENAESTVLEQVNDDELLNLIRTEKYVVVLFSKPECADCDKLEKTLASIREDIVESIGAWVMKAIESHLVKLYAPDGEPALIFFRHGIPLLYDGEINDELILHTFTQNKEPAVRELTDDSFEHLTQAASGATTGDWFIMFYSNDCVDCQRLQARWEAVGARLKSRMNVARVNRGTTGAVTGRRFRVPTVPYFMLFRLGTMYHYTVPKHDVKSLVTFATEWFRNGKAEKVPVPKSPFDDLTLKIADYLRDLPNTLSLWQLFGAAILSGVILGVFFSRKEKPAKVKSAKSVEKTKKSK